MKALDDCCPKLRRLVLSQNEIGSRAAELIVKMCDILACEAAGP